MKRKVSSSESRHAERPESNRTSAFIPRAASIYNTSEPPHGLYLSFLTLPRPFLGARGMEALTS
jgi:hypothetical protein